jgi:hypothetical protein
LIHLADSPGHLKENIELLVIDDFSDSTQPLPEKDFTVRQYRVKDDIPWNQAGSRNLGTLVAKGRWLLFFDIDQKISLAGLDYIARHCDALDSTTMYYFYVHNFVDSNTMETLTIHPNTFLVNATSFRELGMYDEDFAGHYGYEDLYLPYQWEKHGGKRAILGDQAFFVDQKFKTNTLSRDLEPNKLKANYKMATGIPRPKSFIRFDWEKIDNIHIASD